MWKITPTHPVRYSLRSSSNKQSKQSQFNLQINPLPPFFPLTLKWWNNFSLLADFSQTTIEHQISHFIWRRQMKQFVESLNLNTQTNTHTQENHQPRHEFLLTQAAARKEAAALSLWVKKHRIASRKKFFRAPKCLRVSGRGKSPYRRSSGSAGELTLLYTKLPFAGF